jgi:methyl-accepting chemotaxis protein
MTDEENVEFGHIAPRLKRIEDRIQNLEGSFKDAEEARTKEKIEFHKEFGQLRSDIRTSNNEMMMSLRELKIQLKNDYLENKLKDMADSTKSVIENKQNTWILEGGSRVFWIAFTAVMTGIMGGGIGFLIKVLVG